MHDLNIHHAPRWLPAQNVGASEVPAFGLVRVTAVSEDGILSVNQPNADGQDVYINGETPIPVNKYGSVTRDSPVFAYYDTAGTPAAGETWGAASGSWKLTEGKAGFTTQGDPANGRVLVARASGSGGSGYTGDVGPFYKYACVAGGLTEYVSTGFAVVNGLVQGDIPAYS